MVTEITGVDLARILPQLFHHLHRGLNPNEIGELNKSQMKTLLTLQHIDQPNMSSTCEYTGLEKGSMTTVVDSLISINAVERARDISDRRKVVLQLTAYGEELADKYKKRIEEHFKKKLAVLDDEGRDKLSQAAGLLNDVLQQFKEAK